MIDLQALKEQLKLLGHNLPDSQVIAILKEMNIDYEGTFGPVSKGTDGLDKGGRCDDSPPPGPPRTGSILDSFQERPRNTFSCGADPSVAVSAVPYGYTDQEHATSLRFGSANGMPSAASKDSRERQREAVYEDDEDAETDIEGDADSAGEDDDDPEEEDQGPTCRHCSPSGHAQHTTTVFSGAAADCNADSYDRGARQAWGEPATTSSQSAGAQALNGGYGGVASRGAALFDSAEGLRRLNLGASVGEGRNQPGGKSGKPATAMLGPFSASLLDRPSSAAAQQARGGAHGGRGSVQRPASARQPVQAGRPSSSPLSDDDGSDVYFADPDKRPVAARPSLPGPSRTRQPGTGPEAPGVYGAGRAAAPHHAAAGGVIHGEHRGAWLGDQYGEREYADAAYGSADFPARRSLSPQTSTRSFVSRASTTRGAKSTTRKVDRVQRYQQLQQEWSQNKFLKQAGGTTRSTARKPVNFHSYFASMHAAEEEERKRMLRDTRAKTKKVLSSATDAPTANRRDELRWQTRMRLKVQE